MNMLQIHLLGRGFSGRGVRYKILTTAQVDSVERAAQATLTKESLIAEYTANIARDGATLMIHSVTATPVTKGALEMAQWRVLKEGELAMCWDELFTPKDTALLRRAYEIEHSVSKDELDEIMGGKVTVVD